MWNAQCYLLVVNFVVYAEGLVCFNCSATDKDFNFCGGEFGTTSPLQFNATKHHLVNCTGDNAMCFVRSWSARGRHAWLVQRGCYHHSGDDPLPRSVLTPTRAMACKKERLRDAEYRVCLCQADWCNAAVATLYDALQLVKIYICIIVYIFNNNLCMLQ